MWGWKHVMYTWWLWHWMPGLGWRMFPTGSCVQTAGVTVWRRYRMFNVRGPGWQKLGTSVGSLVVISQPCFWSCSLLAGWPMRKLLPHLTFIVSLMGHSSAIPTALSFQPSWTKCVLWTQGLKYTSPPPTGSVRSSVTLMRKKRTNITNRKIKM